jgi:hypothetical protein
MKVLSVAGLGSETLVLLGMYGCVSSRLLSGVLCVLVSAGRVSSCLLLLLRSLDSLEPFIGSKSDVVFRPMIWTYALLSVRVYFGLVSDLLHLE